MTPTLATFEKGADTVRVYDDTGRVVADWQRGRGWLDLWGDEMPRWAVALVERFIRDGDPAQIVRGEGHFDPATFPVHLAPDDTHLDDTKRGL